MPQQPDAPTQLVEHFFRHEYGRLVGALTRSLGTRHLELVEDAVQMALWRALHAWSRHGVPRAPAAWLFRTARNLAIDALRREGTQLKVQELLASQQAHRDASGPSPGAPFDLPAIEDESLRLLFLCCHPSIPTESQVALALKLVGGFSVPEIASGLLASSANIEKRLSRAKLRLREVSEEIAELSLEAMRSRLDAVLLVCYLIFNEGFAASHGQSALKRDVCEEAQRLARMLAHHPDLGQQPAVAALLALMLLHSARFCTRVDADECVVVLADQDRTAWDWSMVREAMQWMLTAARGDELSRYHIEAAIAWEHCRAPSLDATDWPRVAELYRWLMKLAPSPMIRLNALIAQSYVQPTASAIDELLAMTEADRKQLRPWWDCTMAHMFERHGDTARAQNHWRDALALATCAASRKLIEKRVKKGDASSPKPEA